MPFALTVPDGYGYSVIIALGLLPVLGIVQGAVVTTLRPAAKVPYPNAYATHEQAKNSKDAHKFNCAQRAHANLLENMPQTMAGILFSGLFYPRAAPALALVWLLSRILYAYGYITGSKPNGGGRLIGGGFWFAQLGLTGLSIAGGLKMI